MRAWGLAALLAAASCGPAEKPRQPKAQDGAPRSPTQPAPPPALPERTDLSEASPEARPGTSAAAEIVERYYALVGQKDYAGALRLRDSGVKPVTAERFAASFRSYREQRVTVGQPSEPAEANGWIYVEVPVHIYGTLTDGQPFSTAGTVTLRRRPGATEQSWRIYTG